LLRDLWSTILYGMRISLLIGIFAVLLQANIGIVVGLASGYIGGRVDRVLMGDFIRDAFNPKLYKE